MKVVLKRALSIRALDRFGQGRRYIFCYHDVSEADAPGHSKLYSTTPATFRRQLEALAGRVEWVSLEALLATERPRRRLAALTMDDGFAGVRDEAWPYLRSRGIPVALFVCRLAIEHNCLPMTTRVLLSRRPEQRDELLGPHAEAPYDADPHGDERILEQLTELEASGLFDHKLYMNLDDLRYLRGQGVMIGSHSCTHRALATCDAAALDREIRDNQQFLEQKVGVGNAHFALPFGKKAHYTSATVDALTRCGYRWIYTTNPVDVPPGAPGEPRLVPRIGVTNEDPALLLFYMNRPLLRRIDL